MVLIFHNRYIYFDIRQVFWRMIGKVPRTLLAKMKETFSAIENGDLSPPMYLDGKFIFDDEAEVENDRYSCSTYKSTLYPCRHIIFVIQKQESVLTEAHFHPRWLLSNINLEINRPILSESVVTRDSLPSISPFVEMPFNAGNTIEDLDKVVDKLRAVYLEKDWFWRSR